MPQREVKAWGKGEISSEGTGVWHGNGAGRNGGRTGIQRIYSSLRSTTITQHAAALPASCRCSQQRQEAKRGAVAADRTVNVPVTPILPASNVTAAKPGRPRTTFHVQHVRLHVSKKNTQSPHRHVHTCTFHSGEGDVCVQGKQACVWVEGVEWVAGSSWEG